MIFQSSIATVPARWARTKLPTKLFVSYMLVVLVGVATVFAAVTLIAPDFFGSYMRNMMQDSSTGSMGGMMGNGTTPFTTTGVALDAAFTSSLLRALVIATLLATLTALALSLFVSRQIALPVRRMVAAARHIGGGHYAERVTVPAADAGDELGELAAGFNEMAASLESTERRRLELVGDIAHELRTPIATLQGYLEGLLDGIVTPSEETWAKLHTESGRLRRLIDDLQELSRAEARQIPIIPKPVAPASIVEATVGRLGPEFVEKGLTLDVTVPRALPHVYADFDRAVQVLSNLLTNALRYTPADRRAEIAVVEQGRFVAFRVSDNGIGIAPDTLSHVFERFYRADKSRSRALGGAGIGLTIAKALVEAMGGQITAQSAGPDQGSAFTFTLPISQREQSSSGRETTNVA
jgi:signal transduction histidine kinase